MTDVSNTSIPVGTVFKDKWVILELIGQGAMGEVYRAHQLNLKRDIAVKVISPEWLQCLDDDQEEIDATFQRFRREVQAMAQIRHPNILQIFDFDSVSFKKDTNDISVEYIAMEFVQGETLRVTMSEDGFSPDEDVVEGWLINYFFPVLDGVQAMHDAGVVHRDLKPENVLLDGQVPKIADFGLARSCRLKSVTQSIDAKGTPPYMSPEQFSDFRRADEKADIYSLGKILFEAIDGKMTPETIPFRSVALENPESLFFKDLDSIIRKATAETKADRIGSAKELRGLLSDAITSLDKRRSVTSMDKIPPSVLRRSRWLWVGIALAIISVGLMTVWHLIGEPGKSTPGLKKLSLHQDQPTEQSRAIISASTTEKEDPSWGAVSEPEAPKDTVDVHLVPSGTVRVPEDFSSNTGGKIAVAPFLMDETLVTNHQFVAFLNRVIDRVGVEKSVVKSDGQIWLLLGEVVEGYEPIVFEKNKFLIKKSADAACPVLRVTPYGASSYAHFYGKRLPTDVEWLWAVKEGGAPDIGREQFTQSSSINNENSMMGHQMMMGGQDQTPSPSPKKSSRIPLPVELSRPNRLGIRGLNEDVGEWGIRVGSAKGEQEYVVLGGLGGSSRDIVAIPRHPWEAFEEVGFRCVQSVQDD